MSRQAELVLRLHEPTKRNPESYATVFKKQLSSASNDSASESKARMAVKAQPPSNPLV